ncbi:hypothetical protein [Rubripirellula reticaptiva]|uniref:Uncharacterized protein n=1 Tax=Rubripirellula reticaptiva TaxID=2528013 RepID=A0A5C6F4R0_9BACT|nr:hypothetical protein [Rubripirellula reticaptiva]TWU55437.1 hypothetical protein Poly59_17350 [Rubripirellula reticaptiva]
MGRWLDLDEDVVGKDVGFTPAMFHRCMFHMIHVSQTRDGMMAVQKLRLYLLTALMACLSVSAQAHHPDRENLPVRPRIDVIGPIGNRLPASYRRTYNRPTNIGGWIAYKIAPSSQEAMAWHAATHQNAYKCDRPRLESHYFYPKPYEALRTGPRPKPDSDTNDDAKIVTDKKPSDDSDELEPIVDDPADAELAPVSVDEAVEKIMERSKVLDASTLLDTGFDE